MAQAKSVTSVFEPASVDDPLWKGARRVTLRTLATPAGMQVSEYALKAYRDGDWGKERELGVRTWQTRHNLTVLLDWRAPQPMSRFTGPDAFLDRCAILFPTDEETPFITMGSPGHPALIWTWRADGKFECLQAEGPGTIRALSPAGLRVHGAWLDGSWRVAISGPQPAGPRRFTVATWDGSAKERGGMKAFAPEWIELDAM
jgi:DMSO reductase family type II enzyme heme b subunit